MTDHLRFYINGEWVAPVKPNAIDVINPATEESCAKISLGMRVLSVNDLGFSHKGGNLFLVYLQQKEQFAKLSANHALLPTTVDEGIRWVSPVKHFFRTAAKDAVVRGQKIREGDSLLLSYPSGNRDEEVYDHPFEFQIDRTPNRHLAFGYGVHLCLGQHFAKMEMRLLFAELLKRLRDVRLAGQPAWMHANFVGGLKTLPISYRIDRGTA